MISIRGGSGFGDALYVQAIARHFVNQGHRVEACVHAKWSPVFRPLGEKVDVSPFRRDRIDVLAHYSTRRRNRETDQFEDCCIRAGVGSDVELRLDWKAAPGALLEHVRAYHRPVVLLQLPRLPMDRTDGYGVELLPEFSVLQRAISHLRQRGALIVQVGAGEPLHRFEGIDLDLANATSVAELIDLASIADACLGYVSFLVPLSESLRKPALFVWSRRGLRSKNEIIAWLTPNKVLHGPLAQAVVDDCSEEELTGAVDALYRQIGCARAA
jgi:hypothetical protein